MFINLHEDLLENFDLFISVDHLNVTALIWNDKMIYVHRIFNNGISEFTNF